MRLLYVLVLIVSWLPVLSFAQAPTDRMATPSLVADVDTATRGDHFWLGVHFAIADGWHIYWQNPGDSGIPTSVALTLPEDFTQPAIHWPVPNKHDTSGIIDFGYTQETTLLLPIEVPKQFDGDVIPIRAEVSWLVCKDICIPESATLTLDIKVGEATSPSTQAEGIHTALAQLPKLIKEPTTFTLGTKAEFATQNLQIALPKTTENLEGIKEAVLFPITDGLVKNDAQIGTSWSSEGTLTLLADAEEGFAGNAFKALILLRGAFADGSSEKAYTFTAMREGTALPAITPEASSALAASQTTIGLWLAAAFAFIGGIILNLMPCVLPVLSLKALAISKKSDAELYHVRWQGLAYTAGILICFAAFAAIILSLKAGGVAVGWGFQLQSAEFVLALSLLFFAIGLSLFDVIAFPTLFGSASLFGKSPLLQNFATGVLATLVATPCTAPFMASAVGYALSASTVHTIVVFASLGLGLALPYLLICFVPSLRRALPKPGKWMEIFRQALSFPMFATCFWLLWVLVQQTGADGLMWASVAILALGFACWLWRHTRSTIAHMVIAVLCAFTLGYALEAQTHIAAPHAAANEMEKTYSAQTLQTLRAEKKPVFLYATAAWCITCKVNERVLLGDEVQQAFKQMGIVLMKADWTNRDEAITQLLQEYGRSGVPMYIYFAPDAAPKILPQILTPSELLGVVKQ